jgi:hypothetical protein
MYNGQNMFDVMTDARFIVARHREWFARESGAARYHPYVLKAIEMFQPKDWHELLLQWPHESKMYPDDMTRVAYTRSDRDGIADRQTVTTLGKYLRSHFVMPDDAIRDIVALAQSQSAEFKFIHTMAEMIYHLNQGPGSCMQWEDDSGVKGEDGVYHHPYEVYDPAFGWHMAVRMQGGDTVGRALCMQDGDNKFFVRSYKKVEGYSPADEQLEVWLKAQGYAKVGDWENCKLKIIPARNDCGFVAPYLDGNVKEVTRCDNYLLIVDDGDYKCGNTDGDADECGGTECTNCGARVRDGDGHWSGPWEEDVICDSCRDHSYVYAYGRNGRQYYVHQDNAVYVESCQEYYDFDYLDSNGIVILRNGDAEHADNTVEVDGDYYHCDDERIVMCVDDDEYHLKRDVYHHEDSGEYYADEDKMPKSDDDTDADTE